LEIGARRGRARIFASQENNEGGIADVHTVIIEAMLLLPQQLHAYIVQPDGTGFRAGAVGKRCVAGSHGDRD
jgi:hypothetical protein